MRSKRQQTAAKRERELAVREKRQRKAQKKLDRAAEAAEAANRPPESDELTDEFTDDLDAPEADAAEGGAEPPAAAAV